MHKNSPLILLIFRDKYFLCAPYFTLIIKDVKTVKKDRKFRRIEGKRKGRLKGWDRWRWH